MPLVIKSVSIISEIPVTEASKAVVSIGSNFVLTCGAKSILDNFNPAIVFSTFVTSFSKALRLNLV